MTDRTQQDFASAVVGSLPNLAYVRLYPATVVADATDTVDVVCDNKDIGGNSGLRNVPLRHGFPGMSVRVASGCRLLVGFEEGDPSKPYAAFHTAGTSFREIAFTRGTGAVASVGDSVDCFFPAMTADGTIQGPSGPVAFSQLTFTPVTMYSGIISTGNPKVQA